MTEANLAIARKVVLCAGLLAATLLFIYPHWQLSIDSGDAARPTVSQDIGRTFIASPSTQPRTSLFVVRVRIDYVRQITEVAIALLLTFGLLRALKLKKPAGDTTR